MPASHFRRALFATVMCAVCAFGFVAHAADRAALDREFQKFPMFQTIKRVFPDRYEAWLGSVEEDGNDLDAVRLTSQKFTASLLSENGVLIQGAPDQELRLVLNAEDGLVGAMIDGMGRPACAKWVSGDPAVSALFGKRFESAFSTRAIAFLEAIGAALERPVARSTPSDSDWAAFWVAAKSHRLEREDVVKFSAGAAGADEVCDIYLRYIQVVLSIPGDEGERIRADLAVTLAIASATPPQ